MKIVASPSMTARATIGALFFLTGIFLSVFGLSTARLHSAQPASGTLNPTGPHVNWIGTALCGGSADEDTCVEGTNYDTFEITLSASPTTLSGPETRTTIRNPPPTPVPAHHTHFPYD